MILDGNEVRFSADEGTAASTLAVSRMDRSRGRVALACVSESSIFATQWAKVLAEAIIADPVDPLDDAEFADWLRVRRKEWATQLDGIGLAWFERYSLPNAKAEASLLWVQILPLRDTSPSPATHQLLAFVVGDSVLLHYREGKLLQAFPGQSMAELRRSSTLLSSRDLGPGSVLRKFRCHDTCAADDLLVLCNGTTAAWALRLHDFGLAPA